MKRAIIPPEMRATHDDWRMSPAVEVQGLLFLTGVSGVALDGSVSPDPGAQIETAFDQVAIVLDEAGLSMADLVEVTSYHVGLREHLEEFKAIWRSRVSEPFPAWTAIEVAGFASEGVVVELRVVAERSSAASESSQ